MRMKLVSCLALLAGVVLFHPQPAKADATCAVNQSPYNPQNLLYFYPLCTPAGALQVAIVSGGGTGGGASGTPGSTGSTAQYVQGVPGGYPVAVTGTFTSTTTFPYNATQSQTSSTASFLGAVGAYYTTAPTLTNGQVNPLSLDQNGYLNVDVKVGGGGGGGSTTFPFTMNTASPQPGQTAAAIGVVGLVQGTTTVQPLQIDPTTGALLTKSAASVNGTYGAPNTTVSPAATSVQYEQGAGPNGTFLVQGVSGGVPVVVTTAPPTTAVALNAGSATIGSIANTAFGITGALPAGTNTIGSIANTAFGISAGSNTIGKVNTLLPYSSSGGPQTAVANDALTDGCIYNSATPAPSSGQWLPLQCSPTGGLLVSGSFTATTSFPFSLITQGQTATNASGVGVLGVYNSSPITLTTGQAAPEQLDANGYLDVDVKVGGGGSGGSSSPPPYSSVPTASQTPAANTAYAEACPVASPTAYATGTVIPLTCSPSNGGLNIGPLTATVGQPYSLVTQGQTALAASGVGVLGVYNSTAPTLTTGQAVPFQLDASGNTMTNYAAGFGTAATTPTFGRIVGASGNLATVNTTVSDGTAVSSGSLSVEAYVMGYNGTSLDKLRTATIGNGVAATGIQVHAPYIQYNSTLPTITTGQFAASQGSANGIAYAGQAAVTGVGATHFNVATITTNAVTAICTAACTAYDISAINTSGSLCYIQEFNNTAGSVTLGSTNPVRIFVVPATAGSMMADNIPPTVGSAMTTAWSFATTTTPTGSTACGSSVYVTADYK